MMCALRRLCIVAAGLLALYSPVAWSNSPEVAHDLISKWQTTQARALIERLKSDAPNEPNVKFAEARLLFFEGNYKQSRSVLEAMRNGLGEELPTAVASFAKQVRDTEEALNSFDEHTTPDGRFLIRYTGRDKLLLPYLIPVLTEADRRLAEDFGYRPPGRVLVEIYPEIKYLAKVSPLTETDIETSGTIALCKYNRLMFTSPRALVRGYGWQDTLSHEFVHYFVTKATHNAVPIWLHEGIAKFQETRWRSEPGHKLDPPEEDLLARSLAADQLITFDQMHPSMAKLPSQEAAGLAFAEVHTVIGYLHKKKGYAGIRSLFEKLKSGHAMNKALTLVYGFDLDGLWRSWRSHLSKLGLREYPGLVQMSLEFKRPGDKDSSQELEINYSSMKDKQVKDYTHLGELLRARKRHRAALKEYQKATKINGDGNPTIQNGVAESLFALESFEEIPPVLKTVKTYYPRFLRTRLNLANAFLSLRREEDAVREFEAAVSINPFHPGPHTALKELYMKLNKPKLAERAQKSLELLQ